MKNNTKYARLLELENKFIKQISEQDINLLGDISVAEKQLDELAKLLNYLLRLQDYYAVRKKYPLCTSLFLVWCSIYEYKEGNFWDPIFSKLKINYRTKRAEVLGNIFLTTIKTYELQQISETGKNKKYMTPILMHGYIGNHYAEKFLDYLNAVYTSYLKYDVSDNAISSLWFEVFNMDKGQITVKSEREVLEQKEQHIKNRIAKLSIPTNLIQMNKEKLYEQEKRAQQIKEKKESICQELMDIDEHTRKYQTIEKELEKYHISIGKIQNIGRMSWSAEMQQEIILFYQEATDLISSKLKQLDDKKETEITREMHHENMYEVEMGKIKDIKISILTLGKGRVEEGWLILEEYQELVQELEQVQSQLIKNKALCQMEDHLQNTSLKQILTASLTHLAAENLNLFQSFISSTLKLMDAMLRNQEVDEVHRMYLPLRNWMTRERRQKKQSDDTKSELKGVINNQQAQSIRINRSWRLKQPKLRQPYLSYDSSAGHIKLIFPEQQLNVPKNFQEKPFIELGYMESKKKVDVRFLIEKQTNMVVQEQEVLITYSDVKQVTFRCFNIFENWGISLEPVMVFDEKGQPVMEHQIPNGFYYILAQKSWKTKSPQIVDQYFGGPEDYRVYEVYLEEASIVFFNEFTNNEEITIHCSKFSGIKLSGIDMIPGVYVEGVPVCFGSKPTIVIGHQGLAFHQLTFSLLYQGELLHKQPLQELLDRHGNKISQYASELDLQKFLPHKKRPHVEKVEISIANEQGQQVFEKSICLVKGLKFTFTPQEVIIKIPLGAVLKHPEGKQVGASYFIPITDQPTVEVEIYFKHIGWQSFQIETPLVHFKLTGIDGEQLNHPLQILTSEAAIFKKTSINWLTDSDLPQKIVLCDEDEDLVMTFNLRKGQAMAQLNAFFDVAQEFNGSKRIFYRWEGNSRHSQKILLAEVYEKWEITEATLFQTEKDAENLFEIGYQSNFPYRGEVMVRVYESDNPEKVLIDKRIIENPIILKLKKDATESSLITFEIFYQEQVESIFGTEDKEIICWTREEKRMVKKEVIQEVIKRGLVLEAFTYDQERYSLKKPHQIRQITMEPKHFEEEELLKGIVEYSGKVTEVFFYLNVEAQKLPFLIDADHDGVQYHPVSGELFWENRNDRQVMAPLDDMEYRIKEDDDS